MRSFLISLLMLLTFSLYSQETKLGCILIDFENVFDQNITEGTLINTQYEQEFGLTFELEGGGSPRIGEVGNPRTSFASDWGSDTPNPSAAALVGRFFLTDDGELGVGDPAPVILNFETPIDSFAGCILDMDWDEVFKLEAFDEFDNLILADSIRAGDPGTGDGAATCWGFNLDGCVGTVYKVKFSGYNEGSAGFGFAIDNFSFCYAGITVDVNTIQPTCLALDGSIEIFSTSSEIYEYSLDNINFSLDGFFPGLPTGVHRVYVRDENGCETFVDVPIVAAEDPLFVQVDTISTTCNLPNGVAMFNVVPDINAIFTIDGVNFTSDNFFTDLEPGDYTIQAVDDNGCTGELNFTIDPSTLLEIDENIIVTDETCLDNDGTITFSALQGLAPYTFSIDTFNFQNTNLFEGLSEGEYLLTAMDADGCTNTATAFIQPYPIIVLESIDFTDPECLANDGTITVNASGGEGALNYALNDGSFVSTNEFTNLAPGVYTITIKDDNECEVIDSVELAIPLCPIFVPNIISPNGDGFNEDFALFVHSNYNVTIDQYWIYDRWGELICASENFDIHLSPGGIDSKNTWWDGTFKNEDAPAGVYSYLINVTHENGTPDQLRGTLTLVR